jgi:hypothetical protein
VSEKVGVIYCVIKQRARNPIRSNVRKSGRFPYGQRPININKYFRLAQRSTIIYLTLLNTKTRPKFYYITEILLTKYTPDFSH